MESRPHFLFLCFFCAATASTSAVAQSDSVTIRAGYVTVQDRVRPDPRTGIRTRHEITILLSGRNRIDERWDSRSGRLSRNSAHVKTLGGSAGEGSEAWRVLPGNRIRRTINREQSTTTLTISVTDQDRCELDVRYQLKPGYSEIKARMMAREEWGYYVNARAVDMSCRVEK